MPWCKCANSLHSRLIGRTKLCWKHCNYAVNTCDISWWNGIFSDEGDSFAVKTLSVICVRTAAPPLKGMINVSVFLQVWRAPFYLIDVPIYFIPCNLVDVTTASKSCADSTEKSLNKIAPCLRSKSSMPPLFLSIQSVNDTSWLFWTSLGFTRRGNACPENNFPSGSCDSVTEEISTTILKKLIKFLMIMTRGYLSKASTTQ